MMSAIGALLLVLTGWGFGAAAAQRQQERWSQVHTFARLLDRLRAEIAYRAQPAQELFATIAQDPAFAALGLAECRGLAELPVPRVLDGPLSSEVRAELAALELSSREEVCRGLEHLARRCQEAAGECRARAITAKTLYPRLGACAGAVAALILL